MSDLSRRAEAERGNERADEDNERLWDLREQR